MGGHLQVYLGILLLTAAVVDDLRSRKVHNSLILVSLFSTLALCVALQWTSKLATPWWEPLIALTWMILLGLPLYVFGVLGGGDYKMMMAISPLLASSEVGDFLVSSLVWGAVLGIAMATLDGRLKQMGRNLALTLMFRRREVEKQMIKVPFTVGIFFGFLSLAWSVL